MRRIHFQISKSSTQLIGIFLLSLITATSVFVYTNGFESRIRSELKLVPTLMARQTIPVGMTLSSAFSSGLIEIREVARQTLPTQSISTVNDTNGALVVLHEVQPGQFITTAYFGERAENTSVLQIPQGSLAVTVTIGEPEKVATFLQPGSEVAIFVTVDSNSGSGNTKITKVLFTKVKVLAIGNQSVASDLNQAPATSSNLITLAVTPAQAIKLIHAVRTQNLYFALRSDSVDFTQLSAVTTADIVG